MRQVAMAIVLLFGVLADVRTLQPVNRFRRAGSPNPAMTGAGSPATSPTRPSIATPSLPPRPKPPQRSCG